MDIDIDDIKRLLDVQQNRNASSAEVDNIIVDQLARVQQIQDCSILQELKSCTG